MTAMTELIVAFETEGEPPDLDTLCESVAHCIRYSSDRGELPDGPDSVATVKEVVVAVMHRDSGDLLSGLRSKLRDLLFRHGVRSNPGWGDDDIAFALETLLDKGGELAVLRENMTRGKFIILAPGGAMDYAEFDTWGAAFEHQRSRRIRGIIWEIR